MAVTTNFAFTLPTVGGDTSVWGTELNANWTALDALLAPAATGAGLGVHIVTGQKMIIDSGATVTISTPSYSVAPSEGYLAIAAANIDCSLGRVFSKTVTGDITFTVSNVPVTTRLCAFLLELTNGGAHAVTYWSGVKWPGAIAPTLTTSGTDILSFYTRDGGTTWRGALVGLNSS